MDINLSTAGGSENPAGFVGNCQSLAIENIKNIAYELMQEKLKNLMIIQKVMTIYFDSEYKNLYEIHNEAYKVLENHERTGETGSNNSDCNSIKKLHTLITNHTSTSQNKDSVALRKLEECKHQMEDNRSFQNIVDLYSSSCEFEKTTTKEIKILVVDLDENVFINIDEYGGFSNLPDEKTKKLPLVNVTSDKRELIARAPREYRNKGYRFIRSKINSRVLIDNKRMEFIQSCKKKGIKICVATHGAYDTESIISLFKKCGIILNEEDIFNCLFSNRKYNSKVEWMEAVFSDEDRNHIALMDDNPLNIHDADKCGFSIIKTKQTLPPVWLKESPSWWKKALCFSSS